MKNKIFFLSFLFLLFTSSPVNEKFVFAKDWGNPMWHYALDEYFKYPSPYYFISSLEYKFEEFGSGEATFIVSPFSSRGMMIEFCLLKSYKIICNVVLFDYSFQRKYFIAGDIQGGVWSINKVRKIINLFIKEGKFIMADSKKIRHKLRNFGYIR